MAALSVLRELVFRLHLALAFLTRLPLPDTGPVAVGGLARAMAVFPLAGAVIGALAGLVFVLAHLWLPVALAGLVAVVAQILLTGALHEDGLADCADGLGARGDVADRLAVLRDSRIGAFGVLALIVSVAARVLALSAAPSAWAGLGALVAAGAWSRALLPAIMQILPPARTDGLAAGAGQPDLGVAAWAATLGVLVAWAGLGGAAPFALAVGLMAAAALARLARRVFGGHTGDVLGAAQQVAEMAVLVVAAGAWT